MESAKEAMSLGCVLGGAVRTLAPPFAFLLPVLLPRCLAMVHYVATETNDHDLET